MLSQEVFCNMSLGVLNHNCRSTYLQNKEAQIFLGKLKIDWVRVPSLIFKVGQALLFAKAIFFVICHCKKLYVDRHSPGLVFFRVETCRDSRAGPNVSQRIL